jgi:hypothetical protein
MIDTGVVPVAQAAAPQAFRLLAAALATVSLSFSLRVRRRVDGDGCSILFYTHQLWSIDDASVVAKLQHAEHR